MVKYHSLFSSAVITYHNWFGGDWWIKIRPLEVSDLVGELLSVVPFDRFTTRYKIFLVKKKSFSSFNVSKIVPQPRALTDRNSWYILLMDSAFYAFPAQSEWLQVRTVSIENLPIYFDEILFSKFLSDIPNFSIRNILAISLKATQTAFRFSQVFFRGMLYINTLL